MLVLLCYPHVFVFFFFKQKTAYERRISDWSSDVCSSDLRVPELVSQAFHRAMSGRPGPVAVALPEDMLRDMTEAADAAPYQVARPGADPADMARLRDLLAKAKRPLMVLGGAGWSAETFADILAFAEANNLTKTGRASCRASECQDL